MKHRFDKWIDILIKSKNKKINWKECNLWLLKVEGCYKLKVAATYISTDVACSIIGDGRLDFQVRNGAGYDPPSSPTTKRNKDTNVCLFLIAIKLWVT